jgi:hypothetical protein
VSIVSTERVAIEPDFSSKSSTGSTMAQRFVSGSATTYCTLLVIFS